MLARQIGKVVENDFAPADAQLLLDAAGGDAGTGTAQVTPSGGPGGQVLVQPAGATDTLSPTGVPGVSLITPGTGNEALLWAGGATLAAYLLTRSGGGVAGIVGKKVSSLLPVLLLGGAGLYFLLRKPAVAAVPGQPIAPGVPAGSEKDWLLNVFQATWYGNENAMLAAIPLMSPQEIHWLYIRAMSQIPGNDAQYSEYQANKTTIDAVMQKYNIPGL